MTRINGMPGTYIVYRTRIEGEPDHSTVIPYSSEIAGLREAMLKGAQMIFVPYGMSLADAIEHGRKQAEDPAGDRELLQPKRRPRKTALKKVEEPGEEHAEAPEQDGQTAGL